MKTHNTNFIQKLLLSMFLLGFLQFSNAQCVDFNFAFAGLGSERDEGHGVAFLPNGYVVHGGWFDSDSIVYNGSVLHNTAIMNGNGDAYAYCMDGDGEVVWSYTAGGATNSDWCWDIDAGPTGNVFLAGQFYSTDFNTGEEILTPNGLSNGFIICLDQDGALQWSHSVGGGGSEGFNAVYATDDGGALVTGYFENSITLAGTTIESEGGDDAFVGKLDAEGNWDWISSIGNSVYVGGIEIIADNMDNVYVSLYSSGDLSLAGEEFTNGGTQDSYIVKLDSEGNELWALQITGPMNENIQGLATDSEGNLYATGMYFGDGCEFAGESLDNNGEWDFFVAKITTDGDLIWLSTGGGTEDERVYSIGVGPDGFVHVGGHIGNAPMTVDGITFDQQGILVMHFDNEGTLQSAENTGGPIAAFAAHDEVHSLDVNDEGKVAINGFFLSEELTFGDFTINQSNGFGDYQSFVAASGNTGAIEIISGLTGEESVCSGEAVSFSIEAESSLDLIYYYFEDGNEVSFNDSGLFDTTVNTEEDGESNDYYVIIENPCFSLISDTLTLIVKTLPETLVEDQEFCAGTFVELDFDSNAEAITLTSPSGEEQTESYLIDEAGAYSILSELEGCFVEQSMEVVINELPEVSLSLTDTLYCIEDNTFYSPELSPDGGILSGPGVTEAGFNPSEAGVGEHLLSYLYIDENQCPNRAYQLVSVEICGGINDSEKSLMQVYPNPFTNEVQVFAQEPTFYRIYASDGKLIQQGNINFNSERILLNDLERGLYNFQFTNKTTFKTVLMVKE